MAQTRRQARDDSTGGVSDPNLYATLAAQAESQRTTNDLLQQLIKTQTDVLKALVAGPPATPQASLNQGSPVQTNLTVKTPDPNKPPTLEADITLESFDAWRSIWDDYTMCYQFDNLPVQQQAARFRTFLSPEMRAELVHSIGVKETDQLSPKEILEKIRDHIRSKRNIALDRVAFEEVKQSEGESFDSFYVNLRKKAANADLCSTCFDPRLATRIMVGIRDAETRRKLLAITPFPSLQVVVDLCRSEECGRRNDEILGSGSTSVNKVTASSRGKMHPRQRSQSAKRVAGRQSIEGQSSQCFFCGKDRHPRSSCPARNSTCQNCKGHGHFANVCRKSRPNQSGKLNQYSKNVTSVALKVASTSVESVKRAPQLKVDVYDGQSVWLATVDVTPDSAAEASIASMDMIQALGLHRDNLAPTGNVKLIAANSNGIKCVGYADLQFKLNGRITKDRVYFCKGQKGFLLSWYACKDLRILPDSYPDPLEVQVVQSSESSMDMSHVENVTGPVPRDPTADQRKVIRDKLVAQFPDVFSDSELKPMKCPPMKIVLRPGAVPYAVRVPRQIPFAWQGQVKSELDKMVKMPAIEPVDDDTPTEWCHSLVCVPKPSGEVRLCVDMTKLNPYVIRPFHPFPAPKEVIANIPIGCKYFSVFDMTKGYWQMELDKESQHYTTFITPWGRYRFTRAPMGLVSTGDEFCHQGDKAFVDLGNLQKVVDDSIEYDKDFRTHVVRVWKTLVRCREKGITLNGRKFVFAEPEVKFCGYLINSEGAKADPKKLTAIQDFPVPKSLTQLRSFFGLVNQLSCFTPRLAKMAEPLRPLLSSRNAFVWNIEHTKAFEAVKHIMLEPPILASFDKTLPTRLQTDASRSNGLGFTLRQLHGNQWRIVECGSRFLNPAESRYATVELELLGVLWAVRKCNLYLQGLPIFEVLVDHKPLVPILNDKTMAEIENPRLLRMKEKLSPYVFKTSWVKGKENAIADALSRAPVAKPSPEDESLEKEISIVVQEKLSAHIQAVFGDQTPDPLLVDLRIVADADPEYQLLKSTVENGFPSVVKDNAFLAALEKSKDVLSVSDDLVMLDQRVVVPRAARKSVLQKLHASHQGMVKTKRRARQCVYWPGMNSDIENLVRTCEKCQTHLPSQVREPMQSDPPPSWVFQEVAADLFFHAGYHFMVYTDRLSGWPVVKNFGRNDPGSREVIRAVRGMFSDLGVPVKLRSDNGPQFASREFQSFMSKWGVTHVTSSPRYPQSNGLAEAAVKAMKAIVIKTTSNGNLDADAYTEAILEFRNTPRENGVSPAELVFGHSLRSHVPAHHSLFAPRWQEKLKKAEEESTKLKAASEEYYNRSAKCLPSLKMKEAVCVQDTDSRKWSVVGIVVGRKGPRSYLVKLQSGRLLWRNRRFLRKNGVTEGEVDPVKPEKDMNISIQKKVCFDTPSRRSTRQAKPPERFQAA